MEPNRAGNPAGVRLEIGLAVLLFLLLFVMAGCGGQAKEQAEVEEQQETTEQQTSGEGTVGGKNAEENGFAYDQVEGGTENVQVLKDIRFGDHGRYERVVAEFTPQEGSPREGVPIFRARYLEPPYVDAEGNTVAIEGDYLIELYYCGITADLSAPEGYKVIYTGPDDFDPGLSVVKEAKLVPAYELNSMILLIGLGERTPFRVEEETGPPRIIVDVWK